MKTLKVPIEVEFTESYLPSPRHRKLRTRNVKTTLTANVTELSADEAPVAFRLSDYSHISDGMPEVRVFRKRLYEPYLRYCPEEELAWRPDTKDRIAFAVNARRNCRYGSRSLEEIAEDLKKTAREVIIIDGIIWCLTGEPRYVINTFGLGHNHGGTGLFVQNYYNPNISRKRYFSALDGAKAVEEANRIAAARGDTKYVGKFKEMIEVLRPDLVKLKPLKEHGDGDPFQNTLNEITEAADSPMEAGLLAIMLATK